jgi:hypothetical protein
MGVFNGAFPITAGKEDAARAFATEMLGPRMADFEKSQAGSSTKRETWTMQETPMGTFMLVWFDGDIEKAFGELGGSDSEFYKWMRATILDITGVDMSVDGGPPPAVVLDWTA